MDKIFLVLIIVVLIGVLIIWLIEFLFKIKLLKYIISLLFLILTIYFFIIAQMTPQEGFNDLANFLTALLAFIMFLSTLITSFVIDSIKKKKLKIVS